MPGLGEAAAGKWGLPAMPDSFNPAKLNSRAVHSHAQGCSWKLPQGQECPALFTQQTLMTMGKLGDIPRKKQRLHQGPSPWKGNLSSGVSQLSKEVTMGTSKDHFRASAWGTEAEGLDPKSGEMSAPAALPSAK